MDGDWKTFIDRMAYFAEVNGWHLNLLPVAGKAADVNTAMLFVTLGILGIFLTFAARQIKKFITSICHLEAGAVDAFDAGVVFLHGGSPPGLG